MAAYRADPFDKKVDLGIGAYRDNDAKPWVLPVVKKADEILRNDPALNHEYLPISGLESFTSAAAKLILGADSPALLEKRAHSIQTISGTGAVHLVCRLLLEKKKLERLNKNAGSIYSASHTLSPHKSRSPSNFSLHQS